MLKAIIIIATLTFIHKRSILFAELSHILCSATEKFLRQGNNGFCCVTAFGVNQKSILGWLGFIVVLTIKYMLIMQCFMCMGNIRNQGLFGVVHTG